MEGGDGCIGGPLIRLAFARHLSLSPLAFVHLHLIRGVGPKGEGLQAAQCAALTAEEWYA